ncbi:MAG TPA: hypothetical protein VIR45_05420 [Kiloniellaceae bacterium]
MRSLRFLLTLILLAGPLPAAASVDAVKESFRAYKMAILQSDGAAAARAVTQDSHVYFKGLADQALTLDRDGLHGIHLSDRIYALLLRHTLQPAALEGMSGGEVVAYAVGAGWIGREGANRLELGDYRIEGDAASGTILHPDGSATEFTIAFAQEEGRWRLDLVALMELTRAACEYSQQQSGLSEDDFVLAMLEHVSGRKPGPDIWSPR